MLANLFPSLRLFSASPSIMLSTVSIWKFGFLCGRWGPAKMTPASPPSRHPSCTVPPTFPLTVSHLYSRGTSQRGTDVPSHEPHKPLAGSRGLTHTMYTPMRSLCSAVRLPFWSPSPVSPTFHRFGVLLDGLQHLFPPDDRRHPCFHLFTLPPVISPISSIQTFLRPFDASHVRLQSSPLRACSSALASA